MTMNLTTSLRQLDRSERRPNSVSASSMKMTHGDRRLASFWRRKSLKRARHTMKRENAPLTKRALANFADSPAHLSNMSLGLIMSICAPHSYASARQSVVLPVPGGPYNRTPPRPCLARTPWPNCSGNSRGRETILLRVSTTVSSAQTSSNVIVNISTRAVSCVPELEGGAYPA